METPLFLSLSLPVKGGRDVFMFFIFGERYCDQNDANNNNNKISNKNDNSFVWKNEKNNQQNNITGSMDI